MGVLFEPLHSVVSPPERATAGSAGYDLKACLLGHDVLTAYGPDNYIRLLSVGSTALGDRNVLVEPGVRVLVPLGFKARLPHGVEAQIRPRSGLALKQGLTVANTPGTIDEDYPGEWAVLLINTSRKVVVVSHGDRIAQAVFARYGVEEFIMGSVAQTTDRAGGFGSTGAA